MIFRDWNEYDLIMRKNLVINGNFDNGLDGWFVSGDVTTYNGGIRMVSDGSWTAIEQLILEPGKVYELSIEFIDSISGTIAIGNVDPSQLTVDYDATSFKATFLSTSETLQIKRQGACDVIIDSVSVYEV